MAKTRRKIKSKKQPLPAWLWLLVGILIGLGASTWAILEGYIPQPKHSADKTTLPTPNKTSKIDQQSLLEDTASAKPKKLAYDFFTVLEEVEVAVPEREIRKQAATEASKPAPTGTETTAAGKGYIIQVGSFRNPKDAEAMKAQLAFLGAQAHIQKVSIDGNSWQRVRTGPYSSAQKVEAMRKLLTDNGIDSRVYKVK